MRPSPPGTGSWTCDALQGYGEHVGPLWSDGEGALALLVEPRHTNITGRIHGGMAMGLVSIALTQAAQAAKPGEALDLLTQQSELIDSAQPGTWLVAETQVLRSTRTMVFVNARLFDGERVLMNASAVFQLRPGAPVAPRTTAAPLALPPGYALREPVDEFSAHVGTLYERIDEHGERFGGFHIGPQFLAAGGGDEIDTGMLFMLVDLFLGRCVRIASGSVCVTVGMGVSRLAPMRLGDWLDFDSRAEGQTGEALVATGHFRLNGRPVMSATSLWKMVGKK